MKMSRGAMILIDPEDQAILDLSGLCLPPFTHVIQRVVDYEHLDEAADVINAEVQSENIDFVLYSRNDQVFRRSSLGPMIRRLRCGYSTFSGIDSQNAHLQAQEALNDLSRGTAQLDLPPRGIPQYSLNSDPEGSFTLIFDVEQIGGARFGLPRILRLLDRYSVRATFFVTGFIQQLYPDLLTTLVERGHEIGLHGAHHEWLSDLSLDEQRSALSHHLETFSRHYPVVGANFIYRMNANTVQCLVERGLRYFVVFGQHYYRPFAYRRPCTEPLPVRTASGSIWMLPIPVETYSLPWTSVRLMLDSALIRSGHESSAHVNVLMHPFRDGSERHLPQLEKLIHYLLLTRNLNPTALDEWVPELPPLSQSTGIYASIDRINASYPEGGKGFWTRSELYLERIAVIYRSLKFLGQFPFLVFDNSESKGLVTVFPDVSQEDAKLVAFDPLSGRHGRGMGWKKILQILDRQSLNIIFAPPKWTLHWILWIDFLIPRHWQDIVGFLPEMMIRLGYRLRKGRSIF
jgi:peptidoglycan/xylan/chitin deacetylase (PgdA/CDA1 family)